MDTRFKLIREKYQLSPTELEHKFNLPTNSWVDFESGVSEVPFKIFKKLLHLGISVGWLFSGNGAMFALEEEEALNEDSIVPDNVKINMLKNRIKEIDNEKSFLLKTLDDIQH